MREGDGERRSVKMLEIFNRCGDNLRRSTNGDLFLIRGSNESKFFNLLPNIYRSNN